MKWSFLLTLVLIGLVAGDGAWEENRDYRYKLLARTFLPSRETNNDYVAVISKAYLTIRPQSEDLLVGQISQAQYGEVNQQLSEVGNLDSNDRQSEYNQWRLDEPFTIHLENGAIRSLSVDKTMTDYEINQLKVIVSQLQVDTNAQNRMRHDDNRLPEDDSNNAFYKTMEPTVTGNCETIYDITPLPDYLAQSHSEWVPMPELKEDGKFIQIVKTRNYNNCAQRRGYLFDITGRVDSKQYTNQMEDYHLTLTENKRYNVGRGMSREYTNQMQDDSTENKRYITGRGLSKLNSNQMEDDDSSASENRRIDDADMYRRYIRGRKGIRQYIDDLPKDMSLSENRRIIISGSLKKYTIQSSVTTSKVMNSRSNDNNPPLYDYVSVTLESVKQGNSNNYFERRNLKNVGNLVYTLHT